MKRILILAIFLIGCRESPSTATTGPGVEIESFTRFISNIRFKPSWLISGDCSGENDSIRNEYQCTLNYTLTSVEGDLPSDIDKLILDRAPEFFQNHLKATAKWTSIEPSSRIATYTYKKRSGRFTVKCKKISPREISIHIDFAEK